MNHRLDHLAKDCINTCNFCDRVRLLFRTHGVDAPKLAARWLADQNRLPASHADQGSH